MIKFKFEIKSNIEVKDSKTIGQYKIIGRQWSRIGGFTYELQPKPCTDFGFYRLFVPQNSIFNKDNLLTVLIKGCQKKLYYKRPIDSYKARFNE